MCLPFQRQPACNEEGHHQGKEFTTNKPFRGETDRPATVWTHDEKKDKHITDCKPSWHAHQLPPLHRILLRAARNWPKNKNLQSNGQSNHCNRAANQHSLIERNARLEDVHAGRLANSTSHEENVTATMIEQCQARRTLQGEWKHWSPGQEEWQKFTNFNGATTARRVFSLRPPSHQVLRFLHIFDVAQCGIAYAIVALAPRFFRLFPCWQMIEKTDIEFDHV